MPPDEVGDKARERDRIAEGDGFDGVSVLGGEGFEEGEDGLGERFCDDESGGAIEDGARFGIGGLTGEDDAWMGLVLRVEGGLA